MTKVPASLLAVFGAGACVVADVAKEQTQLRGTQNLATTNNASMAAVTAPWGNNPVPKDTKGYFNYDPNDKNYGPNAWEDFDEDDVKHFPDYKYFKEFEDELDDQLKKGLDYNYCGWSKYDDDQAPIDLNNEDVNTECYEYHELREKRGELELSDPKVEAQILPNKLRLKYPGEGDGNPSADIPKGWGHHYPVIHVDFIMPSAHTLFGKRYAGEYQIWIMTHKGRGIAVISVVVDVGSTDNSHFQIAIDEWEMKYDEDRNECGLSSGRQLAGDVDKPDSQKGKGQKRGLGKGKGEKMKGQKKHGWNPFDKSLLTSEYWWGYEGTTMEPPCYPITEYRVLDEPMVISQGQLDKLQKLLFDHVDKDNDCKPTSNHYNGSVARPVQPTKGRDLHRCTCFDYYTDEVRKNCEIDPAWRKKKCPRSCEADPRHEWYKLECPPWYGNDCPNWYEGR